LIAQNSGDFSRLASVGYQLLPGKSNGILRSEDIKKSIAGKKEEFIVVAQYLHSIER
jgi:hypothetical protein